MSRLEEKMTEEFTEPYPYPEIETDYGGCCAYKCSFEAIHLIKLPYKTFIPGTGWGEGNLPFDGALVALCDRCFEDFDIENLEEVVCGFPLKKGRKPFSELTQQEEFGVDYVDDSITQPCLEARTESDGINRS